ncbi:hypothetical protein L596_027444 [Steinernema carpocapsae]|uniref:Uncharacterized protein n=1 Tax=Steinernema carpocapsae TaxID=34508 RepID=A0A4V5ZYR9_STECR|nr:hypothetical protein L596_027444 [Steinernema carpocapsae]
MLKFAWILCLVVSSVYCSLFYYTRISGPIPVGYYTQAIVQVQTKQECVDIAFNKKIAIEFMYKNESAVRCELLDHIWMIKENEEKDGQEFFMADRREF